MRSIILLREVFSHMGAHSGYDQVCLKMIDSKKYKFYSFFYPHTKKNIILSIILRSILFCFYRLKPNPFYSHGGLYCELKALFTANRKKANLIHITYIEDNYALLALGLLQKKTKLIGTIHQPKEWYEKNYMKKNILGKLDAIIILSENDKEYFNKLFPEKVFVIPHGVDTDFFIPKSVNNEIKDKRILFSGHWMRDIKTFYLVAKEISKQYPEIHFDMLVPQAYRNNSYFDDIGNLKNVNWYSGVSDLELRDLYQNATLLFLPLLDSTANNAILEAMGCGLPIVSTKVGAVSEYTNESFAELFPVGDVQGYINCISDLLSNPENVHERGINARQYALNNFAWKNIADQTIDLYNNLPV